MQHRKTVWALKALHGQHKDLVEQPLVDQALSWKWLNSAELKPETEGFIMAAQDQALNTNYYKKKILGSDTDGKCRICHICDETVAHLISGCPVLAPTDYTWRHDKIGKYIHLQLFKHFKIGTQTDKWYEHQPPNVVDNETVTILGNIPVITDREIKNNRPDIIIKHKLEKTCLFIDFTVPFDKNVLRKEQEKFDKYRDLKMECEKMWDTKVEIVPIVVGSTGVVKQGILKYIEKIPGNIKFEMIQKIVLLGTAHILRKCLNSPL